MTPNTAALEPLLSVDEAAHVLGISRVSLYRLLAAGDLPRVKVGNRTMVTPGSLREYIRRQTNGGAA